MATRALRRGPTAERVRSNIQALRKRRGLDLAGLSALLTDLGQPISVSGLSKLENGDRRVDVDDLMALAIALDVTPNRLLLPQNAEDQEAALTPRTDVQAMVAWRWAAGDAPLPDQAAVEGNIIDLGRIKNFERDNRPHDPPDDTPMSEVKQHTDVLAPVIQAIRTARSAGLSHRLILDYVGLDQAMASLHDLSSAIHEEDEKGS